VEEVLRSCLKDGPERAMKLYGFYLTDLTDYMTYGAWHEFDEPKGLWSTFLEKLQKVLRAS
jgi:hypothetical protein